MGEFNFLNEDTFISKGVSGEFAIKDDEKKKIIESHGSQCDCCGKKLSGKTARQRVIAFRATEDSRMMLPNGSLKTFDKGGLYVFGSDCADLVKGKDAAAIFSDLVNDIEGKTVRKRNRSSVLDAKRFLDYVQVAGGNRLDDLMRGGNPDCSYRYITKSETTGQYNSSLVKAALKLYDYYENDNSDALKDISEEAKQEIDLVIDEVNYTRINKCSEEMLKMLEPYLEKTDDAEASNSKSEDTLFLHKKHAQLLVDTADAYYLRNGSVALHSEEYVEDNEYKPLSSDYALRVPRGGVGLYEGREDTYRTMRVYSSTKNKEGHPWFCDVFVPDRAEDFSVKELHSLAHRVPIKHEDKYYECNVRKSKSGTYRVYIDQCSKEKYDKRMSELRESGVTAADTSRFRKTVSKFESGKFKPIEFISREKNPLKEDGHIIERIHLPEYKDNLDEMGQVFEVGEAF